jgi:LysM repeat protein
VLPIIDILRRLYSEKQTQKSISIIEPLKHTVRKGKVYERIKKEPSYGISQWLLFIKKNH